MKLRTWFLLPAWLWHGRAVRRAVRHRAGLQLADARRLWRHRTAVDRGELPAPLRSALSHHSVALLRHGAGRHRAVPPAGVSRGAVHLARRRATRISTCNSSCCRSGPASWCAPTPGSSCCATPACSTPRCRRSASSTARCRCSTTMARCCSAWSTAICRSWCCPSTPRWNASTRRWWKPRPTWARAR